MNPITMFQTPHSGSEALGPLFRFRHSVFRQRLGWDVISYQGQERDIYDDLNPVHMFAQNRHGNVEACWRLLPTTGPYMLKDVFPQLLAGESPPNDPRIWEISRFAVVPEGERGRTQAKICALTLSLLRQGYIFGKTNNITHYVFVTSVAVERLMKRLGLPMYRFGNGQPQWVGDVLTVAGFIPVNEQARYALFSGHLPAREAA